MLQGRSVGGGWGAAVGVLAGHIWVGGGKGGIKGKQGRGGRADSWEEIRLMGEYGVGTTYDKVRQLLRSSVG